MDDLLTINEIEKELRIKLWEADEVIWRHHDVRPGYMLDKNKKVIGLGLSGSNIKKLNRIIDYLKLLKQLNKLSLSHNDLLDISEIQYLTNLSQLNLQNNNITNLSPLNKLVDLNSLNLNTNSNLSDISVLSKFKKLTRLFAAGCKIKDISCIKKLGKLYELDLSNNKIDDISPLKNLKKLAVLWLGQNFIEALPEWITDFKSHIYWEDPEHQSHRQEGMVLRDNPIESPPIEIIQLGKEAIRNYFTQIQKEKGKTQYLFEAKLLVIGDGGTGKTTFIRKVQDANALMPEEKDTTLGIHVGKWKFSGEFPKIMGLGKVNFHLNLWDFGGQKIYQGTHQIFFSDKSLYVLLHDTREQKTDFSYWLNTLEQLGGEDCSLIIVLNKKYGHEPQFDESGYRSRFGKLIKDVVTLDLKNDKSKILELQDKVKTYLRLLPGIGDPLPSSWVSIREDLLKEKVNFISFDRFREICKKYDITNASMIKTLSGYFNRIGAFTHYINDSLLQERIYLNSNWLVKTVYEVLDNEISKSKKGRLNETEIKKIWKNNELNYEVNKLAQLMHNFGLMYHVPGKDSYVIPAHLPPETPYNKWPHSGTSNPLQFIYEFDKYMPQGIMSRLIVALHHHIKNHELVWQRGLNIETGGAYAEIIESYGGNNRYEIRITGSNKIEMLAVIRERFAEVLRPFINLQYKQLVPCICEECKNSSKPAFHEYRKLLNFRERGKSKSECSKSGDSVPIQELLKITEFAPNKEEFPKTNSATPKRIFISYSHTDEYWKDELVKNLTSLMDQELISDWTDRKIEAGPWDPQIKEAMENADIFLLLITHNFLASSYISSEEITKAYSNFKSKKSKIFPIICDTCDWQLKPITKKEKVYHPVEKKKMYVWLGSFQPYPQDGKPIKNWPNPQDGFLDVVTQLRKQL